MTDDTGASGALVALLDHERANLMAQFKRVPVARRAERPGEGAWSAVEIVEHVARVEAGVAKMIAKGGEMPLTATATEVADAQMTAGRIAAVRTAFTAAEPAVLDGIMFPHLFIGPLTLRAWVVLVAHHDARHAAQMAEVADHWLAAN